MNNPMQQSLSPGSGPPIAKKQRGGATPGSIRSRPRPPISSSQAAPPVSENVVDDAIARRRAELRRLQERREAARKRTAKIKADMLNGGNASNATTTALATTANAASQPTPQRGIIEARTSDIFPTAPKSPSLIPKPGVTRRVMASQGVPPIPNSTNNNRLLKASSANPNLPPETPIQNPAPNTPAVGRKLEFPSGQKMAPAGQQPLSRRERLELSRRARSKSPNKSPQSQESENKTRAKSVPPRRPPGPPPRKVSPEKASLDGENSTSEEQQKAIAPPPVSAPSPTNAAKELARNKIQARRPKPVRPGSLLPTTKTKSPKNEEAEATSNPIKKSNSFGSEGGSSSRPASKLPSPKKSPPKSPKGGPPVTKSSSGPPSTATSGPPPTAAAATTTSSSRPTSPPIMPISEGSTLDTSNLTPKTQRPTIGFGSGADTPPSSGSSARRQKLQAMREQALVAASTVAKATAASSTTSMNGGPPTPTSTNKAPSPSISSFYTSSGAPATAAFARAISTPKTNQKEASPPNLPNLNRINRDLPSAEASETENIDKDSKIPSSRKPPKASSSKSKSSKLQSHAQARLEGAYNKSEQENVALLAKIKDLEDKLSQKTLEDIDAMKEAQQKQKLDIDRLLHLADTQGPEAAVQWVQSNVGSNGGAFLSDTPMRPASQKGFNPGMGATPMKGGMGIGMGDMGMNGITPSRRRIAIRALRAAQLGDNGQQLNEEPPEVTERRLIRKFREAAKHVAFEFSTDQATYFVRRPYGIPTEEGLFDHLRPPKEAPDAYARRAHVSDKNTVEVACIAKADNTPLLVFGSSGIRYQTNPSSKNVPPDFVHIPDVDTLDRPLGNINYIDGQANEKQYSLDELLEEALLVREQYCGTLTSTALALPDPQQQQPSQDPQTKPKDDAATAPKEGEPSQKKQEQQQPPPQQKYDDAMDSGSSDVLVDFLGLVVSFFFNLIWGIFIGLPVRIAKTTIVVVAVAFILQYLHIYLAMDHNKWLFESGLAYTTADMAYYSNQLPGMM